DPPFAVLGPPPVDEVDERRVRDAPAVVEPAEVLEHLPVALAPGLQEPERELRRQQVGEEEAQQRLVARLDPRLNAGEPAVQRLPPCVGDAEHAARAAAVRHVVALDPAGLFEPLQLRVDLPVARGPEVADRRVDDALDVVAAPRLRCDEPEDGPCHGVRRHVSARYIYAMYLSRCPRPPETLTRFSESAALLSRCAAPSPCSPWSPRSPA